MRRCWTRNRCSATSCSTLAEWMAQYYLAPLGEVLRGMLPLMAEVRRTVYYRITDLGRDVLAGSLDGDSKRSARRLPEEHTSGAKALDDSVGFDARAEALAYRTKPPASSKGSSKRRGKLSAEEQDLEHRVLTRLASGEPVKVSNFAHGYGGYAAGAGWPGAKKMDCARDPGRGARCAADGAVCRADSRGAAAVR